MNKSKPFSKLRAAMTPSAQKESKAFSLDEMERRNNVLQEANHRMTAKMCPMNNSNKCSKDCVHFERGVMGMQFMLEDPSCKLWGIK